MFSWVHAFVYFRGAGSDGGNRNEPSSAPAPSSKPWPAKDENPRPASAAPGPLLRNLVDDQKNIWTSHFERGSTI